MALNTNISTLKLILIVFSGAIVFAVTLAVVGNLLSEKDSSDAIVTEEEVAVSTVWLSEYTEALALAKNENKPIFIDFTGWTCTNCRWMEANIFLDSQVQELLSQTIPVRLYTDKRKEPEISNKKFEQERFNSIELPLYVLLTPNEELIARTTFTRNLQEFIDFLEKGTNP